MAPRVIASRGERYMQEAQGSRPLQRMADNTSEVKDCMIVVAMKT